MPQRLSATRRDFAPHEHAKERDLFLTIRGLEQISYEIINRYRWLSKLFLEVELDTGQIVPPETFVSLYNKNSISTRLDTTFHFRSEELQAIQDALRSADFVLLTGVAGVGKSRLMLEAAQHFSTSNPSWSVYCIFDRGADIYPDLRAYFTEPGHYLILVDDANRLKGRLNHILQLLHDQSEDVRIKIVATVRDYARDKIADAARRFGGAKEIPLIPFPDKEIGELVSKEEGIHDYHFIQRITSIAQGNPRLAMMAARLALDRRTLDSIADVTILYDEYFGSVASDLEQLGDEMLVKAAGIVSFFRIVDRSDRNLLHAIEHAFSIPAAEFWRSVEELGRLELLDLYEDEIARFSDQVLATYLFYFAVFKKRTVNLSTLLEEFFPCFSSNFVDALNPIINSMGARVEDQLRPHVERKWEALSVYGSESSRLAFSQTFWFVRQTETLQYIRDQFIIGAVQPVTSPNPWGLDNDQNVQPLPLLDLLGAFYGTNHFLAALELALEIVAREPAFRPNVTHILKERFGFRPVSDYTRQRHIIDHLWSRAADGRNLLFTQLFLSVAMHYLRTECEVTRSRRISLDITRFVLPWSPGLQSLRHTIWKRIISLFSVHAWRPEVLVALHEYCRSGSYITGAEIVGGDAEVVIPFIMAMLDPSDVKHVGAVQEYLRFLDREEVQYDHAVRERFTNEIGRFLEVLLADQIHHRDMSYEEEQVYRTNHLRAYVGSFEVNDYIQFLRQAIGLANGMSDRERWTIRACVDRLFETIENKGPDLYTPVLEAYLEMGSPISFFGQRAAHNLIRWHGLASSYGIIARTSYPQRERWLLAFLSSVPSESVTESHLQELYALYRAAPPQAIPHGFQFLERYLPFDERVIVRVVDILVSRLETEGDIAFASTLDLLFNPHTTPSDRLFGLFWR